MTILQPEPLGLAKFCPRQIAKRTSSSLGRDSGGPSVSLAHPPDLVGGSSAASDATAFTKMSPILHRFQRAKSDIPNCSAEMGCKMGCQLMRRTPCPIWDPLPNKTFSWFELVDIPDVEKNKQTTTEPGPGLTQIYGPGQTSVSLCALILGHPKPKRKALRFIPRRLLRNIVT